MQENNQNEIKVLLVGVDTGEDENFLNSMEELGSLAEACNLLPVGTVIQSLPAENKALCVGTGKVIEIKELAEELMAKRIIFDNALTPSQIKNLQNELDLPVTDRTGLILDIFSERAQTREAKLQVETARLQYMLPRLVGIRDALSRQGGASGSMSNKGAGEKKLELDRRKIEQRLAFLRKELEEVAQERQTQRKKREESRIPKIALVGYTNAGKSTVMNSLVNHYIKDDSKNVFEKDMLFATLETAVRKIEMKDKKSFFLSDTVGFIHKLPHALVKAFRATLEEVKTADLLLHVIDFSDPNFKQHMKVTKDTLRELGAGDIPVLYVYNKIDLCEDTDMHVSDTAIYLSAKNPNDIIALVEKISTFLFKSYVTKEFLFPYDKGNLVSYFAENSSVIQQEYEEEGVRLKANCHINDANKYQQYVVS